VREETLQQHVHLEMAALVYISSGSEFATWVVLNFLPFFRVSSEVIPR